MTDNTVLFVALRWGTVSPKKRSYCPKGVGDYIALIPDLLLAQVQLATPS
jgi:hypothetical protein